MRTLALLFLGLALNAVLWGQSALANDPAVTNRFLNIVVDGLKDTSKTPSALDKKVLLGVLYHAGRFEEALRIQNETQENTQDPDILLLTGRTLIALGRIEEGMEKLEALSKQDPKNGKPLYEIGKVLITIGARQRGIKYLQRSIAADPRLVEAHYELALHSTDPDEARRACGWVILLDERGSARAAKAIELLGTRLKREDSH